MPAARDTDWTHIRVVGDKADAAPYVPFARKLLGYVKQDAAYNGLTTHKLAKRLQDGAVVIAEIHGSIPRITIIPVKRSGEEPLYGQDRFVVRPVTDEQLFGVDASYPELWLDAPGVTRPDGWLTRFHDEDIPAYDDFSGPKGVYERLGGRWAFPRGVQHYGNLDHRSTNGLRVSWYGPSSRLFNDAFIPSGYVYHTKVFLHGRVLLDVEAFDASADNPLPAGFRNVYGAGLRGLNLYVVHSAAGVTVDPGSPDSAARVFSPHLTNHVDANYYLCRYDLVEDATPGQAVRLRVAPNSRTILKTWSAPGSMSQPWFFSPDCREARSIQPGAGVATLVRYEASGEYTWLDGTGTPPDAVDKHFTLTLDDEDNAAVSVTEVSWEPGSGVAVLAGEYDRDGNRVDLLARRGTVNAEHGIMMFELDGHTWPLSERLDSNRLARRYLLHADLPERTLVFAYCTYEYLDADIEGSDPWYYEITGGSVTIEVWRRGELIGSVPVSNSYIETGLWAQPPLVHALREHSVWEILLTLPLCPSFLVYGTVYLESNTKESHTAEGNKFLRTITWLGANAMYAFMAWPEEFHFAYYKFPGSGPYLKHGSDRTAIYTYELTADGRYVPFCAATLGDHTMFSGYRLLGGDERASTYWSSDEPLPDLTGVTGTRPRYHPIWRFGQFVISKPQPGAMK